MSVIVLGRVTDDWDRRLIVTILHDFLNPNIVTDLKYKFSDAGDCYDLPQKVDYSAYIAHIQALPAIHPPEVFGLHTNAGITRDMQDSRLLLDSVLMAYGESSGSGGGSYHRGGKRRGYVFKFQVILTNT